MVQQSKAGLCQVSQWSHPTQHLPRSLSAFQSAYVTQESCTAVTAAAQHILHHFRTDASTTSFLPVHYMCQTKIVYFDIRHACRLAQHCVLDCPVRNAHHPKGRCLVPLASQQNHYTKASFMIADNLNQAIGWPGQISPGPSCLLLPTSRVQMQHTHYVH